MEAVCAHCGHTVQITDADFAQRRFTCDVCGGVNQGQESPPAGQKAGAPPQLPIEWRALLRWIAGGLATAFFTYAGLQMLDLRSEGGNSVAEFFYHAMGWFSLGAAAASVAFAPPPKR